MPPATTAEVVCCIDDREVLTRVTGVLQAERVRAKTLRWQEVIREAKGAGDWQALIYDLAPWDDSAPKVMDAFRQRVPAAPILLYPPLPHDIDHHLEVQLPRRCVCLRLQRNNADERQDLRRTIRRMLSLIPCNRLALLVRNAVPEMPDPLLAYVQEALNTLRDEEKAGRLLVESVATRIGTRVRTLERIAHGSGLPQPKELLDWMLLLHATFVVDKERTTWEAAAWRVGVRTETLCRMRHRLMPPPEVTGRGSGRRVYTTSLDVVVAAFEERCKTCRTVTGQDVSPADQRGKGRRPWGSMARALSR